MRKVISTDNAPKAIGTYSQGIEIDNLLFTISQEGYLIVIDSIKGKIIRSNYILDKFNGIQLKFIPLKKQL